MRTKKSIGSNRFKQIQKKYWFKEMHNFYDTINQMPGVRGLETLLTGDTGTAQVHKLSHGRLRKD